MCVAAGFSEQLLRSTSTFSQPSPIQAQCWPIIMSGQDLVGIAATGSGKTLAFGLPGLRHILAQKAASQTQGFPSPPSRDKSIMGNCIHSFKLHSIFTCLITGMIWMVIDYAIKL